MRRKGMKKSLAAVMAFALVMTGSNGIAANAAAKKATVKLNKTSASVTVGKTVTLKVVKKNVKKVKSVTWTTKKKTIATVSSKGVVKGKKAGNTTISCKIKYLPVSSKKYATKTLSCKVTVKKKAAAKPVVKPTVKPSTKPTTSEESNDLKIKWDDTSNVGEAREVSIVGGTSDKMTVKDNGTMRPELSSQDLIKNEMGVGINLGNTMEATKGIEEKDNFTEATDYEQAWSSPVTTQKLVDSIHSYGFNTLRVPVAWTNMVKEDDTTYTINEKMLGRVEEIVNYALNNGMYVIINDHFDYGWWGQFGCTNADGTANETVRANALKRYETYWKQITERFKNYSDHLIFESANEEFGDFINSSNLGFNTAVNGIKGNLTVDECYELTNKLNQDFVNIVRESGGNNASRHLLLAGYNTNIGRTVSDSYKMPKDIEANGNTKLSVSVHYYDPWSFCGDEANGSYTEKDKKNTAAAFDQMKKFTDAGYGVIIGECGVCNPRQDGVVNCLRDEIQLATERGLVPVLWDTPGTYFDREACIMQYKDIAEFFNKITGSNGNTKDIAVSSGKPSADIIPVDIPADATPVWTWTGKWKKNDGGNIGLDGSKVSSTDESKFVQKESCTDDAMMEFNNWGYQTFLKFDWSKFKKPCLKFTFETADKEVVGRLQLSTMKKANGSATDLQKYDYDTWAGKGIIIPEAMLLSLKGSNPVLNVSFDNAPVITSIQVYEMGK